MSPRRNLFSWAGLGLAAAFAAAPVLAVNDRIELEAGYALAGEPFRVVLSGGVLGPALPEIETQDYTTVEPDVNDFGSSGIFIYLRGYELDPLRPYLLTAVMAPRPAGTYPIESKFASSVSINFNRDLDAGTFTVLPALDFDFQPSAAVREGELLTVGLSTVRGCPTFPAPGTPLERPWGGNTFRLKVEGPNCAFPAPPTAHRFVATFPTDLTTGDYHLEIVSADSGHVLARRDFTVLSEQLHVGPSGRFTVEVQRRDGQGQLGAARPVFLPDVVDAHFWQSSMLFSFFSPDNWELMLKVLDGCAINGHFWVFGAAASDVEYQIEIRDLELGGVRVYRHEAGHPAPAITDTAAFPCL